MTLHPCAHCRRHVALDATSCPFCRRTSPTAGAKPRALPARRRPRNAMVLVASSALVVGCGEAVPVYGAPPEDTGVVDTGGKDAAVDADAASDTGPTDTGAIGNLYGAPADVGGG